MTQPDDGRPTSSDSIGERRYTRSGFLKLGGGAAIGAAGGLAWARAASSAPAAGRRVARKAASDVSIHLAATDGWVSLPLPQNPTQWFPDPYAPTDRTTWAFGFRNVTGLSQNDILAQKGKFQSSAPLLYVDEEDRVTITVTNLGMQVRPDLTDGHTIHWHGFRNATPLFDGVPEMSIGVPIGRDFPYFYHPHNAGTYIYHCHWEDVEHVQMGMTGIVFVRPGQNTPTQKFVYNHDSTAYDREFAILLHEWWLLAHYKGAHIQEHDWSDFKADAWFMNGRSYPDTLEPNTGFDGSGNPPNPDARLSYQPISSVIRGLPNEKVLVRLGNLGYQEHALVLPGLAMRVVGKDATLLRGRDGTDLSYLTNTVEFGPGESVDAIITMPDFVANDVQTDPDGRQYNVYPFYDRGYANGYKIAGSRQHAGMRTEVRVYDPNATNPLPAQTKPNE